MGQPHDGISAFDSVVKEVQWLIRVMGLQPHTHLAEFHSQGIDVHTVDAVADDTAHGSSKSRGRGLLLTGTNIGQLCGNASGGIKQDMPGAAGYIANSDGQQLFLLQLTEVHAGVLSVLLRGLFEFVLDDVFQRVFDQGGDEFVRRIVSTG